MRRIDTEDESTIVKATADLLDQWGVGHKDCNNGVALLLALGDRKVGIYAGKGAKATMTERVRSRIIKKMTDKLKATRDHDAAVRDAVAFIGDALNETSGEVIKELLSTSGPL